MKRILVLLLAVAMMLPAAALASEESGGLDLSVFTSQPEVFNVADETERAGGYFIWLNEPATACAFVHAHESDYLYSTAQFELAVYPAGTGAVVVPRLQIVYSADEPVNLHAVSIDVGGQRWHFEIPSVDYSLSDKGSQGIQEHVQLLFAKENWAFMTALDALLEETIRDAEDPVQAMSQSPVHAVLHGDREDLEITFNPGFLYEYLAVVNYGIGRLSESTAVSLAPDPTVATPVTTEPIPAE